MNKYEVAESIHRKANFDTQYISDQLQYSVPEFWTVAGQFGDCEDYALAKRQALLNKGWTHDKLGLVVCKTETGEGHCVLWVATDHGNYILDNRYEWPMPPKDLPYVWESMLCGGVWLELRGWD